MNLLNGAGEKKVKPRQKRRLDEPENPRKKRNVVNDSNKESSGKYGLPEDLSRQFSGELAALNSEERLPNSRIKEIYDSLRRGLLRLEGGAAGQAAAAGVARSVLAAQEGRQLWRLLSTSATAGQAAAALRLLTACVASGGGRAVLAEFQFSHGRLPQVAAVKNLAADSDPRVEFVTFVMAFLVGTDGLMVQALLDKRTPLVLVLSGLSTDRADTIRLVLSTLKQALLENHKIDKKDKLRLLNVRNLAPLLQLYRWRGHQLCWRPRTNRYKKRRRPAPEEGEEEGANPADPAELRQVRESAHQFLTLLCTSHSHGILFRDGSLGTSGVNCNPVLLELLKAVSRPWRDPMTSALVLAALSAAPDLCRLYVPALSAALCPPRQSAEWRAAVGLLTRLSAAVRLSPPEDAERRLSAETVGRAAAGCHFPPPVPELIREGLEHEEPVVIADSLRLLLAVLDRVVGLQARLAESVWYGAPAVSALCAAVSGQLLPPPARLAALWERLSADPGCPDTALLAACLVTCQRAADHSWRLPPQLLRQLHTRLPQLQLPPDQLQSLQEQLQRLTDGSQSAVPLDRPLLASDVPRILAEIRGQPSSEAPSPGTAAEAGEGVEATSDAAQDGNVPSLSGESREERLASFVTLTATVMRGTPPSVPALRALVGQLTETLGGASDGAAAEGVRRGPGEAGGQREEETAPDGGPALPPDWAGWVKSVLKSSLRRPELGQPLLEALTLLCRSGLFPCGGAAAQPEPGCESVSCELLYELLLGHSAFLERVLEPAPSELALRLAVLRLLLQVTARCQHVCRASHLALLLAAYGATLSETDQTILLLMSRYEAAGVSLQPFQPMVWGSAALSFYSPTQGGGHSLKSQPSSDDVIALLDADKMAATCRRLPLKMTFKPERVPADPGVYDPRFVAPLLVRLTAADQPGEPLRLVSSGGLGLALCLLSCRSAAVRAAGWTVLAGLHRQLQASRHRRRRQVWLALLDLLRTAAADAPHQRLPFVVVHAWCRLVMVLQQPTHRLFRLVTRQLLRQAGTGSLQLARVPLFFQLFNSASGVDQRGEQAWMVGHLCQSVRQMSDYGVLQRTVTYKLLMGLAASCLAAARPQLLKVLEVTVRLPGALLDLHYRHGLLVWLSALLRRFGGEPSTRAAVVAVAAQIAETLRRHLERGGPRPAALLAALGTFTGRLAETARGDAALRTDLGRAERQVSQLQAGER